MTFRDYFSGHAEQYAQYRPGYPEELFDYLTSLVPARDLAWDCGTGNGQAARQLARRFRQVIATDASSKQIEHAFRHPGIEYRVEPAEKTGIPSAAVDLVTVGVAIHWFDFDRFYAEVRRVGRPGAILAVWTYHLPSVTPEVDAVLLEFYEETLAGYWPERFRYLHERYETLPFPFQEVDPPELSMDTSWDMHQLMGFVASWSASRQLLEQNGDEPVEAMVTDLRHAWGDEDRQRRVTWPLYFRIGRLSGKN